MIKKRETAGDLIKQERLFKVFSEHIGSGFGQFPSFQKYRIDGFCYNIESKDIVCWVETKWYKGRAHLFLNVPKFNELISLSESTALPSYLLFREYDKWGYVCIHDGKRTVCDYKTKLAGGTPKDKPVNSDDIEPLIILNRSGIIWGKK
jgi:hypothetical protein